MNKGWLEVKVTKVFGGYVCIFKTSVKNDITE